MLSKEQFYETDIVTVLQIVNKTTAIILTTLFSSVTFPNKVIKPIWVHMNNAEYSPQDRIYGGQ
jgi:hypothetical protein